MLLNSLFFKEYHGLAKYCCHGKVYISQLGKQFSNKQKQLITYRKTRLRNAEILTICIYVNLTEEWYEVRRQKFCCEPGSKGDGNWKSVGESNQPTRS